MWIVWLIPFPISVAVKCSFLLLLFYCLISHTAHISAGVNWAERLLGQPCFQFDESLSEKRQGEMEDVLADWISRANKNELLFKLNIIFKKNEGKLLWMLRCLQMSKGEISADYSFILFIFLHLAVWVHLH